ncbi:MAG: LacI family DNA-binding transcriptional regulator [Planctomycetota bacterium]
MPARTRKSDPPIGRHPARTLPRATPTLDEIARLAGVSAGTVSRVLNGKNKENRSAIAKRSERIRRIAEEAGYRPNTAARTMASGKFKLIALMTCGEIDVDWVPVPLLHGIQEALHANKQRLILNDVPAKRFDEAGFIPRLLRENAVDGLLVHPNTNVTISAAPTFERQSLPWLWVNAGRETRSIDPDEDHGAGVLVNFLLERGRRHIGYFRLSRASGEGDHFSGPARLAGVHNALNAHDLPIPKLEPVRKIGTTNEVFFWRDEADRFVQQRGELDSVVCYEMADAVALHSAAMRHGLRVPEDLEIACFHDDKIHMHTGIPVTTALIPFREVGRTAAERLMKLIDAEPGHVDPSLEERVRVPYHRLCLLDSSERNAPNLP